MFGYHILTFDKDTVTTYCGLDRLRPEELDIYKYVAQPTYYVQCGSNGTLGIPCSKCVDAMPTLVILAATEL